jgi:hypothetical protein
MDAAAPRPEAEAATRERMLERGGAERHLVRSGRT